MHQPVYEIEGTYLMPWSRLHAVKDYLDMVLVLEKFPKLKLNVDIVPALLDTIIDYADGANDIHSELTTADVSAMTAEEKSFVLLNFFSPKYETMIFKSERYKELFQKRFENDSCKPDDFDENEISDLMALFNLVWIDLVHFERYPELKKLWEKQSDYTREDRIEIIQFHRRIMSEIIPAYKKYVLEGRLEITASAYYHAILPILADMKSALKSAPTEKNLPSTLKMKDTAIYQIKMALNRIEEIFGVKPKGFWPPELCICPKTLDMLAKEGIEWTISDERVLADSTGFDFVRDFKGNLSDPYHLLKVYQYQNKSTSMDLIFRDRSIPNLINFEYAGLNAKMAAGDLYEKIKNIQNKLLISPDKHHLLTIAQDGENCWENYENDGNDFLNNFYELLENDSTLETVLLSDYIKNVEHKKALNKISTGSCIDKSFKYWIGDEVKNKAWAYLKRAKDTFDKTSSQNKNLELARRELLIAQSSDWFWWYGEPNNSGQDFVFDYMFREHLKNIYLLLGHKIPEELNNSLITKVEIPFRRPTRGISPKMDGMLSSGDDWYYSGLISLLDGPVHRENKNIDKILFGCDNQNMYFRLHVNKNASDNGFTDRINQLYIYARNATHAGARAYIRLISKTDNPYPILSEKFENELTLTLVKDTLYPPRLSTCLHQNMWTLANPEGVSMVYKDVIDLSVPFDTIGVNHGEKVEFFIANTDSGVKNTYIPQEIMLSMTRK